MRRMIVLGFASLLACAPPGRRVLVHDELVPVDVLLREHPLGPATNIRADEIERTRGASTHLVQIRGSESPHRHVAHDLVVAIVVGQGELSVNGVRHALGAGDVAVVPRGASHWFVRRGDTPAVAVVTFAPPLDAPDSVPDPHVDSAAGDR